MDILKEITLEEHSLFAEIFRKMHPMSSELTFPYVYMWRRDYNLKYVIIEGYLCLISNSRVSFPFAFCPIPVNGKYEKTGFGIALEFLKHYFESQGHDLVFGRVEENRVTLLREHYNDRIEVVLLPEASDYVYETEHLINLAGRKYSSKRNHISQFKRRYDNYEYVPVGHDNIHECKRILEEWCDKNETDCVHPDNCERLACYELLNNWDAFKLKGALIKVDNKFEAFTVGELLNEDMAVIRIEKANSDIHGIYTLINQEFCSNSWQDVKYINREEDMGIEGLKKAKLSYYPVFMVNKYLIKVKA